MSISSTACVILSLVSLWSTAYGQDFSIAKYLQKCGGKVYSKCDSPELNQQTIFDEARSEALKNNRNIMIVLGADWCPSCIRFADMLAADKNASKLHSQFSVVKINGDLPSAKALAKRLKFSYVAYPQAFIVQAKTNEFVQQFYPSSYSNVDDLLANIGVDKESGQTEKPQRVSMVLTSSLEKSIDLNGDYGSSTFVLNPLTAAEKYINQGVAALQVYHYLDAYRSFKEAERQNSNNVMAYVGQVIAILQIDSYQEGQYFARQALEKIKLRSKTIPLSKIESAWFEFAKSLRVSNTRNYVKVPGVEVKPLGDAYQDVIVKDPTNIDGHGLITWFSISSIDLNEAKARYESILKKQPNNIGSHHGLLHIYEMENNEKKADFHAVTLARLVPKSAHAQHMYGHTLPQKGRWAEALDYFKKAHDLHLRWSEKNGLNVDQDWHYAHNLDLMAGAYLGLGDLEKAKDTWKVSASQDTRAVPHYLSLLVVMGDVQQVGALINYYETSGWGKYFKPLRIEMELTPQTIKSVNLGKNSERESDYDKILQKISAVYLDGKKDPKLTREITEYFVKRFKSGGFDGWSNAYIEMLRLKRIASILSMTWLLQDLSPLEFAVQTGSLCSSATKAKGLTRCMK